MEEEKVIKELEQLDEQEDQEILEVLRENDNTWENRKTGRRAGEAREHLGKQLSQGSSSKRAGPSAQGRRRTKKLKYSVLEEDWGQEKTSYADEGGAGAKVVVVGEEGADDDRCRGGPILGPFLSQ